MLYYDGPAEVITKSGNVLAQVKVHLESQPPQGPRLGSWRGRVFSETGTVLDSRITLGDVTLRLPDGRTARAIVTEKPLGPAESATLVGSGPPPF
mgnify:CR=1 FL=1